MWLIVAHFVFTTLGFAMADGVDPVSEGWTLITTWDFVLMATVSMLLFIAVAVSSVRLARKKLSYESWHGIHLYAYLAIALGFAHQLVVGTDFVDDPIARAYWIGLYVATIGTLVAFRFGGPLVVNARHRFRVANVVDEAPGVVSVYLTGRDARALPDPRRSVRDRPVPDRGLVARPPVQHLRPAERPLAPSHGQGAR